MNNKILKKLKRAVAFGISVFTLCAQAPIQEVDALDKSGYITFSVNDSLGVNITATDSKGNRHVSTGSDIFVKPSTTTNSDLIRAWCIQPEATITAAQVYNFTDGWSFGTINDVITDKTVQKRIQEIVCMGYGYGQDVNTPTTNGPTVYDNDKFYEVQATQAMIWDALGYTVSVPAQVKSKVDEIQARIDNTKKIPSFNGNTYTLTGCGIENAITITDTNGAISNYRRWMMTGNTEYTDGIWSSNGINWKRTDDENGLIIWADEGTQSGHVGGNNCYLTSRSNMGLAYLSGTLNYGTTSFAHSTNQNLLTVSGIADPKEFRVNINVDIPQKVEYTGVVNIQKQDSKTGTTAQGDATLKGTKFTVKDSNGKSYGTVTSDANGKASLTIKDVDTSLTYSVTETKAPAGYTINSTPVTVKFDESKANAANTITTTATIKDNVKTGSISITKMKSEDKGSSLIDPEEGAQFAVILASYVTKCGSFDKAYNNIVAGTSGLNSSEYGIMTTDKNGSATLKGLAYGQYKVKQIKASDGYTAYPNVLDADLTTQTSVSFTMVNEPETVRIQLLKVDSETKQPIAYTGAQFKIKNARTGKYVTYSDGNKTYDTFATAAMTTSEVEAGTFVVYNPDEENLGNVVIPVDLPVNNTYTLEEVSAPAGYVMSDEEITINLKQDKAIGVLINGILTIPVTVENTVVKGEFSIEKQFALTGADTMLADAVDYADEHITDLAFALIANDVIVDPQSGEVLYNAGDVVSEQYMEVPEAEDQGYVMSFTDLYPGTYTLRETETIDGFAAMEDKVVEVIDEGNINAKVVIDGEEVEGETPYVIYNMTEVITFSKVDLGGEEVVGATITITDNSGEVVDEWISTDTPHSVSGLVYGETYFMTETIAPDGYIKSQTIAFVAGEVVDVQMVDEVLTVKKVDLTGNMIGGAKFEVYDLDGNLVDAWTTVQGEAHAVSGLELGHKYVLKEVEAPKGYVLGADKVFEAREDTVEMVNLQAGVDKVDNDNKALKGAVLQVLDGEDNVIDEWTTDGTTHYVEGLQVDTKYTLHEKSAPKGYKVAKDIEFKVDSNAEEPVMVKMIDYKEVKTARTTFNVFNAIGLGVIAVGCVACGAVLIQQNKNKKKKSKKD